MNVQDTFKLDGRVAVITGSGRGLGMGMAEALAEAGSTVVIADIDMSIAEATAKEFQSKGYEAMPLEINVTDRDSVQKAADAVFEKYGRIDILVNNAGVVYKPVTPGGSASIPFKDVTIENWQHVIGVNVFGVFNCSQIFGRYMLEQGSGNIINIASLNAFIANVARSNTAYCVSKGGVRMLTTQLASEWAPNKIRVNAIAPGYMRTELGAPLDDPAVKDLIPRLTPMERPGTIDDLKGATVFLASDASSYVTGQTIIVDGGYSLY